MDSSMLENLVFRLWVASEGEATLNSASIYDFMGIVSSELDHPENNLFSEYSTEEQVRTAVDRLVPEFFQKNESGDYCPNGFYLLSALSNPPLPEPYHSAAASVIPEWKSRWRT
ncbi:hypothetical protein HY496_00035 [Candidatus Woesearchaeota archaeon]|nr:hypothetical protein [Candidatus Woesearchaeota archaeon]